MGVKQRIVLDMAADRGPYIDQSQSLNIHMVDASTAKLSSMHFHGWQSGLKTGMYYLRTKAAVDAIKVTVEVDKVRKANTTDHSSGISAEEKESSTRSAIEKLKATELSQAGCINCSA